MISIGDVAARRLAANEIESLAVESSPEGLVLVARVLGDCEASWDIDRTPLRAMLASADPAVVNAALDAIRCPEDRELLVHVVVHLDHRRTAGAAVRALSRSGDEALALVDVGLRGDLGLGLHGREQLARVCRAIGSAQAVALLRHHVQHRDREVGLSVMTALAALGDSDDFGVGRGNRRRRC